MFSLKFAIFDKIVENGISGLFQPIQLNTPKKFLKNTPKKYFKICYFYFKIFSK